MAALVTFVFVAGLVLGIYALLVVRPERRERRRLRERLSAPASAVVADTDPGQGLLLPGNYLLRARQAPWTVRPFYLVAAWLTQLRDQSGMNMRMRTVAVLMASAACVVIVAAWSFGAPISAGPVFGATGAIIPLLALFRARAARLRKFEELLPEATDVIARALRVGQTLPAALQMVGEELPDPVGAEFRLLHEHFQFGAPLPEVLRHLADRVPLVDIRFLVTAILLQRDTGGNLSELLDNLAMVIRDRFRVRRKVRSVTAHGRLSGWILSAIPVAVGVLLMLIRPDYIQTLVTDDLGRRLLIGAIALEAMGVMIIRRIVRVEY